MELKTTLNKEMARRYNTVKKSTGMHDDKSVLAFLVNQEYGRIQKAKVHNLFLSKETYDLTEKAANARGQTIDKYVQQVIEEMIKNAKEGVEHGS